MKFLHTGDWHLGKTLRGQRRDDECEDALQKILTIAREEAIDCLLVAGDIFDSSTPSAEAERQYYGFFRELRGLNIPAVVIGGNHDHAGRLQAVAGIMELVDVHVRGKPVLPDNGGVVRLRSRDKSEQAVIAALPWVPERHVVEFDDLLDDDDKSLQQYADRASEMLTFLAKAFSADTVNVALAHILIDGATIGPGGGERPLHLGQTYAVNAERLPANAQYIALGHIHKPQRVVAAVPTQYAGSLLQLDFGEVGQEKSINIVDIHPRQPAEIRTVPIAAGRQLLDIERPFSELPGVVDEVGDAYLRVNVLVDQPIANLAERVREILPNALHIVRVRPETEEEQQVRERSGLGPDQLLASFYLERHGQDIPVPVADLFRRLYDEETHASAPA